MTSKRDWLDAGFAILNEHGARALTIERLTERMGLTKGSFYHHFGGMPGYVTALLAHFEAEHTTRIIEVVEEENREAPARERLQRLAAVVVAGDDEPELEVAMRSWALQSAEVEQMQERVDRARVDYMHGLWRDIVDDDDEAEDLATLFYLVFVGAGHVRPPVPLTRVGRLYALVMRRTDGGDRLRGAASPTEPQQR